MSDLIATLAGLVHEWSAVETIPEVDWARMRTLEFQEALRSRDALVERLVQKACVMCGDFDEHVSQGMFRPGRLC